MRGRGAGEQGGRGAGGRRKLAAFYWPLATLPVLILIFFNKMAFSNLILGRGDTFLYFYPYWHVAAEAVSNGRIPLWNPHLFMGAPFLANSQVGFFYPFNWPLWLWLPTPYAVSASILLHLFIAGCGAYWAGRRCLLLGRSGALVTAVLFALGGYLTAQVEHINQLQGLAWLPCFFVALNSLTNQGGWQAIARGILSLSALFTLQLLAGHSQTTFITGLGLGLWGLAQGVSHLSRRHKVAVGDGAWWWRILLALMIGVGLAGVITAVQLLPTLELAQLSSRQGGLPVNEVLSFSLHPLLLTRALLPAYGQSLFSEYVAFLPLSALMLATVGAWQWRRWRGVYPALILVGVGLFLALGAFNPLYWLLARLPGFNLFRVPARWLILTTFGLSLLAGVGWQIALDRWLQFSRPWSDLPRRARAKLWVVEWPLAIAFVLLLGLILWGFIAPFLTVFVPTGAEAPAESPNQGTMLLWLIELLVAYVWLSGQRPLRDPYARFGLGLRQGRPGSPFVLGLFSLILLFVATRTHPYNSLTTPEAYFDVRPPITRLQAEANGRFLSLSHIFFDPGDQAEIDTIYADQLPLAAQNDYTVAIKQKEIVAPNLPMIYDLASVDGFDGGILPTDSYSQLVRLVLPDGVVTTDGRLRENLTAVPPAQWLDLFSTRYIITDKVGDIWQDGVFFDMQHPVRLDEPVRVGYVPAYEATELWLMADSQPGEVIIETAVNTWHLIPQRQGDSLYHIPFPQPATPLSISISPPLPLSSASPLLQALSLVDSRDDTFQALVPANYRLIHSGDVKIYENLDVLPRAYLVDYWQWQSDVDASLVAMQQNDFAVGETAVLTGDPLPSPLPARARGSVSQGTATIVTDDPERIVIQTNSPTDTALILADAQYPGWQATIDGVATAVYPANAYFRGILLPAGQHEVMFAFESQSFSNGRIISLIGVGVWAVLFIVLAIGNRSNDYQAHLRGLLFSRHRPTL